MPSSLFPPDFTDRLEYLSLVSKRAHSGALLAQRRVRQDGSGVEFAGHRDYVAGDDIRYIDWNIYARHGDLLLRRFQEERDLHVYLMLDCSPSMQVGEPAKFDLARQLVAALAYIALADLDCVAVYAFANGEISVCPLTRGKNQALAMIRYLTDLSTQGRATDLEAQVDQFLRRRPRRGLVITVSDLLALSTSYASAIRRLRFHHHDVHIIQLHAAEEAQPPWQGNVEFVDIESGEKRHVAIDRKSLQSYQQAFARFQTEVREFCKSRGVGCTQAQSDTPYDQLVLAMIRAAASR